MCACTRVHVLSLSSTKTSSLALLTHAAKSLENDEDEEKHMQKVSRKKEGKKERMSSRQTMHFCRHEDRGGGGGVRRGRVLKNLEPPLEIRRSAATNRTEPSSSLSPKFFATTARPPPLKKKKAENLASVSWDSLAQTNKTRLIHSGPEKKKHRKKEWKKREKV